MNRTLLNVVIDLVSAVLMLGMIATGYLLRFPLPPGSNKSLILWGWSRHQWGDVHFWISLSLLIVMLLHLVLHWNWVVSMVCKYCGYDKHAQPSLVKSGIATALIVGGFCFGFAWLAESQVTQRSQSVCSGSTSVVVASEDCVPNDAMPLAEKVSWKDVYPIMAQHCINCHGVSRQLAGVRVDRREDLLSSTKSLVVPGKSSESVLLAVVAGKRTTNQHKLAEAEIAIIKAWIDQGAK